MTDHLPDVIQKITTLEQVPEALKQVADYINSIPETVNRLSPYPVPEEANALQAKVAKHLSEHALTSLEEAKEGTYSYPDFEQSQDNTESNKSPELLLALDALTSVAEFVWSAHKLGLPGTVDPDSHRANEAQSRFDKVMEMLKTNAPSLSLESGLDSPEYASPEWFTEFIENHPELYDLRNIDGQILKVYALAGSNEYKKAFAEIDKIDGVEDSNKVWAKIDVVAKVVVDSDLTLNEAFEAIDKIDRLSDSYKAGAKRDVVIEMAANSKLTPDEAFAIIDGIKGLSNHDKARVKRDVIVKMTVDSDLTPDEAFAAIDKFDGLEDYIKARVKRDVAIAKLSIVGDKEKMAKALELGFSNQ